jgi:hypothetical protein
LTRPVLSTTSDFFRAVEIRSSLCSNLNDLETSRDCERTHEGESTIESILGMESRKRFDLVSTLLIGRALFTSADSTRTACDGVIERVSLNTTERPAISVLLTGREASKVAETCSEVCSNANELQRAEFECTDFVSSNSEYIETAPDSLIEPVITIDSDPMMSLDPERAPETRIPEDADVVAEAEPLLEALRSCESAKACELPKACESIMIPELTILMVGFESRDFLIPSDSFNAALVYSPDRQDMVCGMLTISVTESTCDGTETSESAANPSECLGRSEGELKGFVASNSRVVERLTVGLGVFPGQSPVLTWMKNHVSVVRCSKFPSPTNAMALSEGNAVENTQFVISAVRLTSHLFPENTHESIYTFCP